MAEKEAGPGSWPPFRGYDEMSTDRVDAKRTAEDRLEAMLLKGPVGEELALTPGDWQATRLEALAQVKNARKTRV